MTDKGKGKANVRDIQEQTGWPYQHTKFIVEQLGYGAVSEAVDACHSCGYDALRAELGAKAREAQRLRKETCPGCGTGGAARHVDGCPGKFASSR